MNNAMTLGTHHLWKTLAIDLSTIKKHHHVLDIACGTGDLSLEILNKCQPASLVSLDLAPEMLEQAKLRFMNEGILNHHFTQGSCEELPFDNNQFHRMVISFGFRNFSDQPKALQECARCLKSSGILTILEFSAIQSSVLNKLYSIYAQQCIPNIAEYLTKDRNSYQYLVDSIEQHPNQQQVNQMMINAGFYHVQEHHLLSGLVTIHQGYK